MYRLKISGYLMLVMLSVTQGVSARGRTGYVAPNHFLDFCQLITTSIFSFIMLKYLWKSVNPKEDMSLGDRLSLFLFSITFGALFLYLMSVSLNALGIIDIHL